jgi:hypothetical protein
MKRPARQWHRPAAVPPPVSGSRTVRAAGPSLACPGSLNVSKSAAVLDTFPGRVRATDISSLPRAACRVKVRSHARVRTAHRNFKYMRAFAIARPERAIVQEALAQIPWYHHIALLEKLDDLRSRIVISSSAWGVRPVVPTRAPRPPRGGDRGGTRTKAGEAMSGGVLSATRDADVATQRQELGYDG